MILEEEDLIKVLVNYELLLVRRTALLFVCISNEDTCGNIGRIQIKIWTKLLFRDVTQRV